MTATKRAITTYNGRVYTHRILFAMAERALKRASTEPRDFDARLTATVFSAFAVEAYINLVIEQLEPGVFADERNYFRGKYAGLRGKIRWTLEQLNATPSNSIDASRRHVLVLLKLRDELAHSKPISYSGSKVHAATEEPPFMESQWVEEQTLLPKVRRYVRAVQTFCDWLNSKAAGRIADPYLHHGAFGGVHQSPT